jgi:hypothetical protein
MGELAMSAGEDRRFVNVEARFNDWRRAELARVMGPPIAEVPPELHEASHVMMATGIIMLHIDRVEGDPLAGRANAARAPIRDIVQKVWDLGYLAGLEAARGVTSTTGGGEAA